MCLGLLPVASVRAQSADSEAYQQAIAEAMEAHKAQRWADARAHFERAHGLHPNARTLRGMGASAFEQGQFALAIRDLEAALVHPERALSPELRQAVEALLAEARPQVGSYVLRVRPEGAELRVNGAAPITGARGEVLLERGEHHLEVSAPGHVSQTLDLSVVGGEREEVRVVLAAEPKVAPAVVLPSPAPITERPVSLPEPRGPLRDEPRAAPQPGLVRGLAIGTTALGGLSFAATGTLFVLAKGRIDEIGDACRAMPGNECTEDTLKAQQDKQHLARFERGLTATIIVGGASLAAASVLWVLDVRARRKPRRAQALAPLGFRF